MLLFLNLMLLMVFFDNLSKISFVAAGAIPLQKSGRSRQVTRGQIDVGGLEVLKTYVCPSYANMVRRQVNTGSSGTIQVVIPLAQVAQLWQELKWILGQLETILDAEGLFPVSSAAATSFSTLPDLLSAPTITASSTVDTGKALLTPSAPGIASTLDPGGLSLMSSIVEQETSKTMGSESVRIFNGPTASSEMRSLANLTPIKQTQPCQTPQTVKETTTLPPVTVVTIANSGATNTAGDHSTNIMDTITTAGAAASSTTSESTSANSSILKATSNVSNSPTSTSTSSYVFNSQSTQNIAVYFGQTPVTGETTLVAQCADPNIDIVILSFVISQKYRGKYPLVNFGAACDGQTQAMASQAPGLLSCPNLERYIQKCQQIYGKKVLLSIGGAASALSFSDASEATDLGNILWQLFGPPGQIDLDLRPFGNASIDGFDVDNEDNLPSHFDTLATTLRANYATDSGKSYYLSSAPQCPFPDASIPLTMILLCDFVFVQFYNNVPCEIGSPSFNASVQQWSSAIEASTLSPKPRLYVGAPSWSAAGATAYQHIGTPQGMQEVASQVEEMGLNNFGGIMFWDGPEGMSNVEGGKDIVTWAKEGLVGSQN